MANAAPARLVLERAEETNRLNGHENLGPLSLQQGYLPVYPTITALPKAYRLWDEVAAELPTLIEDLAVRPELSQLPVLPAGPDRLPDRYLTRAATILGNFAHAYYWSAPHDPVPIPECVLGPWEVVCRRLERPEAFLADVDVTIFNWRPIDPQRPTPLRLENLALLIPLLGIETERVFQLTQVVMLAEATDMPRTVVEAQEAVLAHDLERIKQLLYGLIQRWRTLTGVSFLQINPNAHSRTYVNPLLWGKVFGTFSGPVHGELGLSGQGFPLGPLMDSFLGRQEFGSRLGQDYYIKLRAYLPSNWRAFLEAVEAVSVREFVLHSGDKEAIGLFYGLLDAYAGEKGYLGAHRLKVYGFLELGFKAGRSATNGGFATQKGLYADRIWNTIDDELDHAREERHAGLTVHRTVVRPSPHSAGDRSCSQTAQIMPITFDIARSGLVYEPGDRCAILPENSPELIQRTLAALHASGSELVRLNSLWRQHAQLLPADEGDDALPLATLLRYGRIRSLPRKTARRLYQLSGAWFLRWILQARADDQWELREFLTMLEAGGFNPQRLWQAEPGEAESICNILQPEPFRLYSIASAMDAQPLDDVEHLHLNVGVLRYATRDTSYSRAKQCEGTASGFLARLATDPNAGATPVVLKLVSAPRFHLPEDPQVPIVLFASGSGIAPFSGFLRQRIFGQPDAGDNWLFYAVPSPDELFCQNELEAMVRTGKLQLRVAFSRADTRVAVDPQGTFAFETAPRQRLDRVLADEETSAILWELLRSEEEGGRGAYFYVCGRTSFAVSMMDAIREVIRRYLPGITTDTEPEREARAATTFYQLIAEGRYRQDVFTTYSGPVPETPRLFGASEVALHNNSQMGYWLVVSGKVHDVSDFMHWHPGGHQIVLAHAGSDATAAYRKARHHANPEVDALLGMCEIGAIRRLDFGTVDGAFSDLLGLHTLEHLFRRWVRTLYLIVEMENTLVLDFSLRDVRVIGGEILGEPSLFKLQLIGEAHERFLSNTIDGLTGEPLTRLWALTTALCNASADSRWLERAFTGVDQSVESRLARSCGALMRDLCARIVASRASDTDPAPAWTALLALATLVEQEARWLNRELKLTLAEGVQHFENYESEVIDKAGHALIALLERLPTLIASYYTRLASGLRRLDSTLADLGQTRAAGTG